MDFITIIICILVFLALVALRGGEDTEAVLMMVALIGYGFYVAYKGLILAFKCATIPFKWAVRSR